MSDGCPKCDEYKEKGYQFCGACGRNLGDAGCGCNAQNHQNTEPEKAKLGFIDFILVIATIFVIFITIFEAVTLVWNFSDVFGFLPGITYPAFLLVPSLHVLFYWEGLAFQIYWIFLAGVILSCVTAAVMRFIDAAKAPGGIMKPGAAEGTAAFWICVFICATMAINLIVMIIMWAIGGGTTVPPLGSRLEEMFALANASVWEEIVTRVLYIGVPMMFISLIVTRKKESLKCIFGGFGMSTTALVLILISAAIFGLAHYDGWDHQAWKVISVGIMGVFLGYLFVRFGLYAAILYHFITDYISAFKWMGGDGLLGVVGFALIVIGFVALIYILMRLVDSKKAIESLPLLHK